MSHRVGKNRLQTVNIRDCGILLRRLQLVSVTIETPLSLADEAAWLSLTENTLLSNTVTSTVQEGLHAHVEKLLMPAFLRLLCANALCFQRGLTRLGASHVVPFWTESCLIESGSSQRQLLIVPLLISSANCGGPAMSTLLELKSSVLRQVQRSQSLRSRREPPPTGNGASASTSPKSLHKPERIKFGVAKGNGEFFERMNKIVQKQDSLLVSTQAEEEIIAGPPPPECTDQQLVPEKTTRNELDLLYEEAVYTVVNRVGVPAPEYVTNEEDLFGYLQKVFDMSQEEHEIILQRVRESKRPGFTLRVSVMKGKNLMAKDANGYSDPYCMLGILVGQSPREAEERKERRFSFRKRKEKLEKRSSVKEVLAARDIQVTEVKPETLNPVWNEHFVFDIDDVQNDLLHLDIWDHDDDVSVAEACRKLNEISGFRGMGSRWYCYSSHHRSQRMCYELLLRLLRAVEAEWEAGDVNVELTVEEQLKRMVLVVDAVCFDIQRGQNVYNKLFHNSVKVDFFSISYRQLEKLVADDVNVAMERVCGTLEQENYRLSQTMGETLFEVFISLKTLKRFREFLPLRDTKMLALTGFHNWFKSSIHKWLQIVHEKSVDRIRKAVETDQAIVLCERICLCDRHTQFEPIQQSAKHSVSAVDVTTCFSQVQEFWTQLAWPDSAGAFIFITRLTDNLCSEAVCYAELLKRKIERNQLGQEQRTFIMQLSVALNNTEYVRTYLSNLPRELDWRAVEQAMAESCGAEGKEQVNKALNGQLYNADLDLQREAKRLITHLTDKMVPELRRYIQHISLSPDTINNDETLVRFFHASGEGLLLEDLKSGDYKVLEDELRLNKCTSFELIEQYFLEKISQQRILKHSRFGRISVKCYYDAPEQRLTVEILHAADLIALDANGLSDPFVIVELCPHHLFPNSRSQRTQVKLKTLHPVFDELFYFHVSPDQYRHRCACLTFTVMDYDWLSTNDFAGEAVAPLSDFCWPGRPSATPAGKTLQPVILHLARQKPSEKPIMKMLEARTGDREAQEFVRKLKEIEKSMEEE
ncbi:BAI1-associated protein 3 [Bagarius yarrelli]|uniref:BAI1-associated protein 3 n=1 Tax=Bagarius yarrelli TaxID=175774 RepID=A0A556V8C3_BAGYA|nr:BAI1-associated protein 3 [Bagarius yarrelli]